MRFSGLKQTRLKLSNKCNVILDLLFTTQQCSGGIYFLVKITHMLSINVFLRNTQIEDFIPSSVILVAFYCKPFIVNLISFCCEPYFFLL